MEWFVAIVALLCTLVTDRASKTLALQVRGSGSLCGGWIKVKPAPSVIWLDRLRGKSAARKVWLAWAVPATTLSMLGIVAPSTLAWSGLLLGGSLSHVLERQRTGTVLDFIEVVPFPRFNLADIAITAGSGGVLMAIAMHIAQES